MLLTLRRASAAGALVTAALLIILVLNWADLVRLIILFQQQFYALLASHIRSFQQQPLYFGSMLATISFAYGVFHAAGPGHGKTVLVTYLTTQPESIKQGLRISFAAALLQAAVAISLVTVVLVLLQQTVKQTNTLGLQVEQASYLLVMVVGLYLLVRSLRALLAQRSRASHRPADHQHKHEHHDHRCEHSHQHAGDGSHQHAHCNHSYAPSQQLSRWQALAVVVSMGLRPCSGAIVVLIYAQLVGIYWVGILATVLMGLGTGLTVALLGWVSISMREFVSRWVTGPARHHHPVEQMVALLGGLILIALGWSLLSASQQIIQDHPLF